MHRKTVTLIPGDGIGPEITEAVQDVFQAARVPIDWEIAHAGISAVKTHGGPLPQETLESIRRNRIALKGPTTTPLGGGHKSVNVTIRKSLDLFANVRPAVSLPGIPTHFENLDLMVVRENLEDTYSGIEHWQTPDVVQCLRVVSRIGCESVIQYALDMARAMGRRRVTCVHKANIQKMSDGLFLETFGRLSARYDDLQCDDILVDNLCMQLVTRPERLDVLVLPNMFGDIVSDLCAGLVGGLGVAPAANIGYGCAVFEAVHGSAPDIAGQGLANPTAILLSAVQMLRYLGIHRSASDIENALRLSLLAGVKTRDLGGHATTIEFTRILISSLPRPESYPKADQERESQEPSVPKTEIPASPLESGSSDWTLTGVDVFLDHEGVPRLRESYGSLRLTMIGNRGTKVFPGPPPDFTLVDWYRCRFLADGPLQESEINDLLIALTDEGFRWVHVEKLHSSEGDPRFSRAQGE